MLEVVPKDGISGLVFFAEIATSYIPRPSSLQKPFCKPLFKKRISQDIDSYIDQTIPKWLPTLIN